MGKLDDLRYTRKVKEGRREYWLFNPPQDAIDAGVVKREVFRDGRRARTPILQALEKLDGWRKGVVPAVVLSEDSTLNQLIAHYLDTTHYQTLSESSRITYAAGFKKIAETPLRGRTAGDCRLYDIDGRLCQELYENFKKGHQNCVRWFSVLVSYAISLDLMTHNPMAKVKKVKHQQRSVVWERGQVVKFLDLCFSKFEYRSVGLIALMCYEWMQRPTDIRTLKWDSFNWDKNSVTITQSKRGAIVEVPIPENLQEMLGEQHKDFSFQEYVVPHLRSVDKAWRPYTKNQLASLTNKILKEAGLPIDLRLGDLRKTSIMEAVEADVPITTLMSVTGHKNLTSLTPYVKPTLKAATTALDKRREFRDD